MEVLSCFLKSFFEFCELFLPSKQEYQKVIKERTGNRTTDNFSLESRLLLTKFFRILLDNEFEYQKKKSKLFSSNEVDFPNVFEEIKSSTRNYITGSDLIRFFRVFNQVYSKEDIEYILKKIDKTKTKRISYTSFLAEVDN